MVSPSERSDEAAWSELEEAFFAAAPPDDAPAAEVFVEDWPASAAPRWADDVRVRVRALGLRALTTVAGTRAKIAQTARQAIAQRVQRTARQLRAAPWLSKLAIARFTTPRLNRRGLTIALAAAIVLMGLSAGVVASRSGGRAGALPAPEVTSVISPRAPETLAALRPRTTAMPRPHTRASKQQPHARSSTAKHAHREHRKIARAHGAR